MKLFKKLRSKISPTQKQLARWAAWFFLSNVVLWIVIATNYLTLLPAFDTIPALTGRAITLSLVFIISSFIGYFSLIAFAAWLLVACSSGFYKKGWVFFLSLCLSVFLSLSLIIDSLVYHLFHFHLWGVVWSVLSAGVAADVLVLSSYEWFLILALALLILLLELFLARIIWRLIGRHTSFKQAKSIAYLLIVSFFLSYVLLVKSYAAVQTQAEVVISTQLINLEAHLIPFYNKVMGSLLPESDGFLKLQMRGGGAFLQLDKTAKALHYPLQPLQCNPPKDKFNIVIIVIDALRFDALNAQVMPNLNRFAGQSWQFEQHYSGGNATGPGIFTLMYGLPYSYWTAMLRAQQAPVLMEELQKQGYEMGIYRSASMEYPAFNKTVFANIKNLQLNTSGNRAYVRDQKITEQFTQFLKNRNPKKPFFGFLFYDALHNYCQRPTPYAQPFQPAIGICNRSYLNEESDPKPYLNRYYNAAHFVDGLIGRVLSNLQHYNLLNHTWVIITADHGEEFNDSHKNYWGHVSAYTDWQLHVPFLLYRPGQIPKKIPKMTTHYEVAPFLMHAALGCSNPASDYSVGSSLFGSQQNPFFVASSYVDYAILNEEHITRIYPEGNYVVSDRKATPCWDSKIDEVQLRELFGSKIAILPLRPHEILQA